MKSNNSKPRNLFKMKKTIAVIQGDGIGPEVIDQATKIMDCVATAFGHEFEYKYCLLGGVAIDETGQALPQETIDICKSSDAVLLGAIGDPKFDNNPDAEIRPEKGLLQLRKELELFANIRPIKTHSSLNHLSPLKDERVQNVDFIIYRELTGGIYFGEKTKGDRFASDLCLYHEYEIERIARLAFEESSRRNQKLCLVDKANVLESSRLWRRTVQNISEEYPEVTLELLFVDNAAMQLILNPSNFDVILTSNMFGDILSDEASVIAGSIGLLPSASYGGKVRLYEPVHGSYPQAKGKDIANPIASILSVAMMLRDFGMTTEAQLIEEIINEKIAIGNLTHDLSKNNPLSCSELGNEIAKSITNTIPVSNI